MCVCIAYVQNYYSFWICLSVQILFILMIFFFAFPFKIINYKDSGTITDISTFVLSVCMCCVDLVFIIHWTNNKFTIRHENTLLKRSVKSCQLTIVLLLMLLLMWVNSCAYIFRMQLFRFRKIHKPEKEKSVA